MTSLARLESLIGTYRSVLVGYSGGVDSALLAVAARRVLGKERAVAAMGLSASYPRVQHERALAIAATFDLQLLEVATDELDDLGYVANAPDRCYFCKRELWCKLSEVARNRGIAVVADGTNADDLGDHRPGLRAAAERRIRSPLAEAGFTKTHVRAAARELGIPVWDAPASPCLSSRVMYGLEVTPSRLRQVEEGEDLLRDIGVRGDLRVRHRGREARIEVLPSEFARVREHGADIAHRLLDLGFDRITLDLGGYRRGSQLEGAEPQLELLARRG
jgi:uncharacterized protein